MNIIRASHLGMCFGVRDAIDLALEHRQAGPLTVLGDLVHNPAVLSGLRAKGIAIETDVTQVKTPTVMVTAHGASERSLVRTCITFRPRRIFVRSGSPAQTRWVSRPARRRRIRSSTASTSESVSSATD